MPTVTLMLLAALTIAGVAVSASLDGQGGVARDRSVKSALGVAESGVEQALLRYNRYGLAAEEDPCAPLGGGTTNAEGWCPEVNVSVNEGTASYRVKPSGEEMSSGDYAWTEIEVVSTGTLSGVSRRVDVIADSSAGQEFFLKATVQAKESIELDSNSSIHAGTATNGDLILGSEANQCGTATVGIGKELVGEGGYYSDIECGESGGEPTEDEIKLPPVNQGDAPEDNDNDRLFTQDRISGNKNTACFDGHNGTGKEDKSCGSRELVIGSNSSVTIGGSVYSFCKLTLNSNSALYIAPGAEVLIYFDSPEACGYEDGVVQLELRSNSRITPASGKSGTVALLFVGSPNTDTKILLNSETTVEDPVLCEQNFVIYAPYTDIEMDSNTAFCGAMAGKSVYLNSNAEVWTSSGVNSFYLPLTAPHYEPTTFVDCTTAPPAGAPDEGC